MLKKIFTFLFFIVLISGIRDVFADDDCAHLQEKIQIILPLEVKVSQDFARVSDPYLCRSMSNQCEYFYTLAKLSQEEYRDTCDTHYQIVKSDKCDYSATPCVKIVSFRNKKGVKDYPL